MSDRRSENAGWAASLPLTAVAGLASLRFLSGAEALVVGEQVWLRGEALNDADELRLRQTPGLERFDIRERDELFSTGSLLPCGRLPTGAWRKLRDFIQPEQPPLRIVSGTWPQLTLSLVRDTVQRETTALLTSLRDWEQYALSAAQVRLNPLKFAMNGDNQVLIVGSPLPPLTGQRFWEEKGIFTAAGWHWSPAVEVAIIRRVLQLGDHDLALWYADGRWELIRQDDFVAARRAAVRATAAGVHDK
ncbi:hypothetical protein [Anatilimnocola floriformis]|uniref:hypothetical protein n=1 Tax=Anatilimnocola floriformis TaxID=2948575 RepID=UPI0020C36B96|nr:hypothetical protein [Anatilimnocola floriformis]